MTTVATFVLVVVLAVVTGCIWAALYYGIGNDDDDYPNPDRDYLGENRYPATPAR
jgi:hypothetical protein